MRTVCNTVLVLGFVFLVGISRAGGMELSARATLDRATAAIGDRVLLSIELKYPKDCNIEPLEETAKLGEFEVLQSATREAPPNSNGVSEIHDYHIAAYSTGDFTIPQVSYVCTAPDGSTEEFASNEIGLPVAGVGASGEGVKDIQEIDPPFVFSGSNIRLYLLIGAVLLVIAAVLAYLKFHKKSVFTPTAPPPPPPWITARKRLDEVRRSDYIRNVRFREFATEVPAIIWDYLEGRFNIPAPSMTTIQLLEVCRRNSDVSQYVERIDGIQRGCDMVKFAKADLAKSEMENTLDIAYNLVQDTTPGFRLENEPIEKAEVEA
jgi:hypothetical protein